MNIGPDTALFLSMSSTPGRFGATVYNTLFDESGIDAVYLPRRSPLEALQIIEAMDTLNVRGCSVSSPHKAAVLPFLDSLDTTAAESGAVNTIYRDSGGNRVGACTDIDGIVGSLGERRPANAVIHGSGGVVGPAIVALRRLGVQRIAIVSRNSETRDVLRHRFDLAEDRGGVIDLLVNATPDGRDSPPSERLAALIDRCVSMLDMPVLPGDSHAVKHARDRGVDVITGVDMCVEQIAAQARLYLGTDVRASDVRRVVREQYFGQQRVSSP